jgi:hypothetical protein
MAILKKNEMKLKKLPRLRHKNLVQIFVKMSERNKVMQMPGNIICSILTLMQCKL